MTRELASRGDETHDVQRCMPRRGRSRSAILHRLHDAKRPETRARRLARFVAMLEAGERIQP